MRQLKLLREHSKPPNLHELEQLLVADERELRTWNNRRNVAFRVDDQAALGVSHRRTFRPQPSSSSSSDAWG